MKKYLIIFKTGTVVGNTYIYDEIWEDEDNFYGAYPGSGVGKSDAFGVFPKKEHILKVTYLKKV